MTSADCLTLPTRDYQALPR